MTRYEKIKSMTMEEMAAFLEDLTEKSDCVFPRELCHGRVCVECRCEWLLQEVSGDG